MNSSAAYFTFFLITGVKVFAGIYDIKQSGYRCKLEWGG